MPQSLHFSIVIPAKDAAATIANCVRALLNQQDYISHQDYEIIVVDDGSSDQTASIARELGVQVISQVNAGPAAARNAGVQQAQGEIILFTDADCIPTSNWLAEMVKPFNDSDVVGVKGAYLCQETNLISRFVQQEFEYKYLLLSKLPKIDFIDTYSAAYRKNIFKENGGFDMRFPVPSVEDQELSFRLARKGYKLVFQPSAKVYHQHDVSVWEYFRRKWGIGYWKAFLLRWLPEKTLSDTYTPISQRLQIFFLALTWMGLFAALFFKPIIWIGLVSLMLFFLTAIPFLQMVWKNDRKILVPSLFLLFVRAGALGFGLVAGFLFPPRSKLPPRSGLRFLERLAKRVLDISAAIIALILFSPIMLISAFLIKLDSPGKIIFSQERSGENGKPFRIYKLRTMVTGAEEKLQQLLEQNNITFDQPVFKLQNDPRVTRVGRFLRRWSLDEIPQFWNILRSDMSLVGPRPEESWVVAMYDDRQRQRLAVKPGLTGPMQVSGRGNLEFEDRLALELEYIQHYSFWLDLKIIFQTITIIISGKGAY